MGGRETRTFDDPDFGKIIEAKGGGWEGTLAEFWSYKDVQLLLGSAGSGIVEAQRALYRALRPNRDGIRERVEDNIRKYIANTSGLKAPASNPIQLSSIFFPADPSIQDWRVWYELKGEDIYWFGVVRLATTAFSRTEKHPPNQDHQL